MHSDTAKAAVCKQILCLIIQSKKHLRGVKEMVQRQQHHSCSVPNCHTSLLVKKNGRSGTISGSCRSNPCGTQSWLHLPLKCLGSSQMHSHMQVSTTASLPTESMLLRPVYLRPGGWQLLIKSSDKFTTILVSQMETTSRDFVLYLHLLINCTD